MRVRLTFTKQGALRYTGHLDLHKIIERSIRRAKLPLAYSQGYHPQPKLSLAAALPLGFSSRAEVMDIWFNEDVAAVVTTLQTQLPPGLTILGAVQVDEREPSLQSQVVAAEYEVTIMEAAPASDLNERIASVIESNTIPRERRSKQYDLRPLIEELSITPTHYHPRRELPEEEGQEVMVFMRLSAREGATGRPEEVLQVLGIPVELAKVERSGLIFKN